MKTKTGEKILTLKYSKEINYWIQLTGLIGMDRIYNISANEYLKPQKSLYFAISPVMSVLSLDDTKIPEGFTSIKLIFRHYERLETGHIYKFVGYEQ